MDVVKKNEVDKDDLVKNGGRQTDREIEREREKIKGIIMSKKIFYSIFSVVLFFLFANNVYGALCVENSGEIATPCEIGNTDVVDGGISTIKLKGISQFMTINEGGLLKNMVIASDTNEGIYILGQYGGVGGAGDDGSVYFGDSANHLSSLFIGDDLVSGGQGNGSLTLLNDAYIDAITITSDGVNPPSLLIIDASKTLNVKNITNSINSSITNKGIVSISAGASGQINKIVNNGTITNNAGGEFIINNYNVIENNATFDNHGIISINGNTSASFNIGSNGTLNMYNGSFINAVSGSFIENYGLINLIGGTINADVLNIYTNGKLVIEGSGSIAGKIHGACGGAGCGEIEIKMNYDMSAVTLGSVGNVIDKMAINNNAEVIIGNGSVNAVYINNIDVAHGGKLTSNGLLHGNVIVDGEYIMNYEAIGNIEVKNKGKAFIQALLTGDVIFSRSGADIPTATLEMGGFINGNISGDGTLILNRDYNSSDSGPPSYTTNFGLAGNTLNKLQIEDGKTFTLITGDSAYISHTDVKNNSLINVGGSLTGNINLLDATSVAKIINNGTIDGTAKGIGAVHIEYDYNDNVGTSFGSNLEHLSKLYINENLALSTNAHFTDSSEIKTGKTLTIENSGILNGNVYGDGKLILLNNGAGVKVGTSGSILSELEIGNGSANSAFTISENSNVTNTKIFSGSSLSVNGTGAANIAKLTGDVDTDGVYELGKFGEHYGKLNVGSGGNANLFGKLTGDMIIGGGGNAKIENDANSIVDGFIYGDGTLAIEKNYNVRETYFGKRTETQGGAVTIDWLNTLLIGDGTNSSNLVLNRDAAAQSANCYDASTGFCGASYVENIIINKNSSLEIDFSSGARIYGNVTGEGTLILNGNIVDIDDQSPNPNTLTFGGVANMIDTVRINGDLTFSDFGVTTNNFFKNIELVNNSIIKLGTQEGASDSYTATLTLYGKLKIANGSIFYINDEGILNLECLSGTQLCGSVEGIIFGNNVSGTGTININIDNFKLSTNKTTIGEANHVIDVVNIGDSVTSIHVEFDSNSQSAPENIHHINKVVISSGSSLTLSNKTDIKGTIVGSDLKIYKNYNDINTTFGASGDNIALLWVGAGGEKNNKLELKEVNKEAYITDLVVWGDNELFVSNTLNIGNQIHLKAGGKYVLEGKQDGKTLNEGGAIILKGEHIGDLLSRYDSVLDIKGGILNGDIVFEEGGANNIVNIYAGGLVKGAIYNCYWGCQQIVGGKVNILGDYIDTYTLFGDLSVGANGEYLDYLTIGDSNHNATLEIKTNDAYIAEEMKINSGSSLILNKNLTLGDSFINEGTYTVEISGSHIGYSNNNINKGLYILEGMHEGDVENYGTYHIKGFNGTQKNSNVINYGEFIVGDDTVTGSKGYLRGDNKIEQSGTTKLLGGGEINGMIYGDGVLDIGTQYISDSSVIPSPPTPGRVTTFGNVTEHLKNLVITGSKNGLELVNNSTHYIDLSTLNGQIGFLDVHDGATLHGDVTINYSGICASSYQYCNMYFLGFVINNVSTIGIQYGNVINDNSMTIVDDSKLYGDILLKTQGITLIDNRGVGKDSVSGFIYGAGKLELQRDYDDDITSFGKSNNYLGTLEIQDKDINDPDIYTTFTIKNGKDNYINNVIILDGQVFKIETNGVLDGGVTNNSYGCTSSLNCGGFVIEGTFHGNNLINNGARTYIYEGSEVVGNIYGNNSGDVFVGEGCDDGSEPSCYNGYKDSTSFGLSGNKLDNIFINGVDFSLQGGRGIYANNFNIENVINNLSKDANGDGMHDKALIMNKGSSMQAKFDFGNSAVDKDKFIIVALDTGDDIAISTMLNNIQNSYDGAVNVNNGKVFLLYELPEDGTWAKIYKGSYNMDDVTLTYYDNNPLSGSIFDRTWVLAPDASDSAYLSIQKCQSNCDGFTPRGNELSVAANDLANYINRSFKPNNQTLNEIILTTRLKGIQNRNQFIRALENLSPHLILNGLQRQMAANTIMSGVVNVNRRLTYYKNYRYGAIYGEFNIPTNSDVKYYNDYYSAPFSQNNFWYEFFAGKMKQNEYEKIYGYDNNYYGFSLGYDIKPTNSFLIGGSYTFNYMDAKEDDKNASTIKAFTQLADIHVMNYSRHHWITVGIGGGLGYNHSYRNVDLIRSVSKASADFFNQYYYGRAEAGLNFILFESKPKEMLDTIAVNEAGEQRILHRINTGVKGMKTKQLGNMNDYIMLAPRISIQKDLYKFNKFTEKGDSGVNLSYDMEDINKLDASFGADLIFSGALSKQSALQFIFNYTLTKKLHDDVGVVNACLVDSPDGCFKWYAGNTQDIISDYGLKIMWHRYEQSTLSFGYTYSVAEKFYGHHISFNTSLSF